MSKIKKRIQKLGLELPEAPAPKEHRGLSLSLYDTHFSGLYTPGTMPGATAGHMPYLGSRGGGTLTQDIRQFIREGEIC